MFHNDFLVSKSAPLNIIFMYNVQLTESTRHGYPRRLFRFCYSTKVKPNLTCQGATWSISDRIVQAEVRKHYRLPLEISLTAH